MTTAVFGSRARWTAERRFYFAMSVAILLVVYVGFARSFFLRPLFPDYPAPTEPIFYVHGILFAAWTNARSNSSHITSTSGHSVDH